LTIVVQKDDQLATQVGTRMRAKIESIAASGTIGIAEMKDMQQETAHARRTGQVAESRFRRKAVIGEGVIQGQGQVGMINNRLESTAEVRMDPRIPVVQGQEPAAEVVRELQVRARERDEDHEFVHWGLRGEC
jgi:hypothetical protein